MGFSDDEYEARPAVTHGPERDDGLPDYVVWRGKRYETPPLEQIEEWTYDSVCDSLEDDTVEPDGIGPDGAPSWLLALGLA
jgi:hypothetical protein